MKRLFLGFLPPVAAIAAILLATLAFFYLLGEGVRQQREQAGREAAPTYVDKEGTAILGGIFLIFVVGGSFLYFIPSTIAGFRGHPKYLGILITNTLAGMTVIGWVVALVWSFNDPPKPQIVNVYPGSPPPLG